MKTSRARFQNIVVASFIVIAVTLLSAYVVIDHNKTQTALTHCLPSSKSSLAVTYPAGGEVFHAGQKIRVRWTGCNISSSDGIEVDLTKTVNTDALDGTTGHDLYNLVDGIVSPTDSYLDTTLPKDFCVPGAPCYIKIYNVPGGDGSPTARNQNYTYAYSKAFEIVR
jgi:hypothetical protein